MQIDFRKLFAPPVFPEDEDKSRSAAILNTIGWSSLLMVLGILLVRILQANDVNLTEVNWILAATMVLIALILLLAHRGYVNTASVLFAITLWAALSYIAWAADGIRDIAFFAYTVPIWSLAYWSDGAARRC
jgi:O-antigen/teichoic acid export membrane protein